MGWAETRKHCERLSELPEKYRFAAKEFGLIQIQREILSFLEYVSTQDPVVVGEIGLKNGGNTFLFMHALPTVRTMVSMDLLVHNEGRLRSLARAGQNFMCIEGDTHKKQVREKVKRALKGKQFDLLFIDGDHSYEGVRQDHEEYKDLVREGGLIAFHDIVSDTATREGTAPQDNCYAGGVHKYWAEIKDQYSHKEFVESWNQSGFGIGVIWNTH